MEVKQKYSIIKDAKTDVITYKEYENLKGFKTKPKKDFKSEDMVNVSKMIVINPSLIEKLVDKKCKRNLERILKMLTIIYEDDESDDTTPLHMALDELEKFKTQVREKYKEYMAEKEYKLLLKKIEILIREVKLREATIYQRIELEERTQGKKGR